MIQQPKMHDMSGKQGGRPDTAWGLLSLILIFISAHFNLKMIIESWVRSVRQHR